MRVLILGGTVFLGRHLVDAALRRGDEVTLFHRGRHASPNAGQVDDIAGDRATDDLERLRGRTFDCVLDTCGYLPADVRRSSELIDSTGYVYVSTASVYAPTLEVPLTEDAATHEPPDPANTDVTGDLYGPQKRGCEIALHSVRGEDSLILRAGLISGPFDPSDRLTYWAARLRRPGPVLAPDVPAQPVQFIDARDLANWMLDAAAAGITGVMNANGPSGLTFGGLLRAASAAAAGSASIRWVAEDDLLNAGVQPWSELPIWLPQRWGVPGLMEMDTCRAQGAGLRARPVADSLRDIADWAAADDSRIVADYGPRAQSRVLTPQREAALLATLPVRPES